MLGAMPAQCEMNSHAKAAKAPPAACTMQAIMSSIHQRALVDAPSSSASSSACIVMSSASDSADASGPASAGLLGLALPLGALLAFFLAAGAR